MDGLHSQYPIQETTLLRFFVHWPTGNCAFLGQLSNTDLPPKLRLASALKFDKQLFSYIFTSTFVTLSKKKVKRQYNSKEIINKATAELPKQDQE